MQLNEMQHEVTADRNRLLIVLAVTALYCAAEFIGGYYANSLALISDAVHLLTDVAAILLSLFALWVAARPARAGKTYGYLRAEILGALLNGLFLWVVVAFLFFEAVRRFSNPAQVNGLPVMVIAAIGLLVNSFWPGSLTREANRTRTGWRCERSSCMCCRIWPDRGACCWPVR